MIDFNRDLTYSEGPDDLMDKSISSLVSLLARRRSRLREFNELKAPQVIIRREERMVSTAEIALKAKAGRLPPIPELSDGWDTGNFDPIPDGDPGSSKKVPFLAAPDGWEKEGIPDGAWCFCDTCNLVGRSTRAFDFFAENGPGSPLTCEACKTLNLRKISRKNA